MRVPHGTTVLVADGRKRLIARNTGDAESPSLTVIGAAEDASRHTRAITSEASGTQVESNDPQEHEAEQFAIETAQLLRRGVEDGSYESLVIVAAPKTLGTMRKHYHKMVTDKIIGEIGKDVTSQPISAVEKLLIAH